MSEQFENIGNEQESALEENGSYDIVKNEEDSIRYGSACVWAYELDLSEFVIHSLLKNIQGINGRTIHNRVLYKGLSCLALPLLFRMNP